MMVTYAVKSWPGVKPNLNRIKSEERDNSNGRSISKGRSKEPEECTKDYISKTNQDAYVVIK